MALSKITEQERELMKQKSAQSLPDVPSLQNWTPKQFKNAITKVLFDNKESFYSYHNKLVDEINNHFLTKEDEKVYKFSQTFSSVNDFVKSCNAINALQTKIFYGVYTVSGETSYDLVGIRRRNGSVLVISGSGELIYTDGTKMLPISVNGELKVAEPTTTNSATTKSYVDAIDSNLKSNIANTKSELESEIVDAKNELGNYIDSEIRDVDQAHIDMVNIAKNELNSNINSKTSRSNIVNTIGMANSSQAGLLSAQDYTLFKKLVGLLNSTSSNFVDTLEEVLNIFENYPEGTNLIEKLGEKVDKTTFEEYKTEVDNKLKETDVRYTNLTPTPSAIGGIGKGQTFNDVLITDVLNDLLYPYVAFSFTISTSPSAGVKEFNQTINVTSATVNITKGSAELSKIEVYNGSTLVGSKTNNVVSGNNTITFTNSVSLTNSSSNKTIKAVVTDSKGESKEQSATFTFVYPYYYGAISASATLTESLITGLTKVVTTKASKSYTITMNQRKAVYAYPSSYGNLTKILDANSFDVTETFVKHTLTIHGVSYYVYVLDTPATSEMKYTFNY